MRNIKFQNNQYYHIYNRGVDKRRIFKSDEDFKRFLKGMGEFNDVVTKTERKRLQRKEPEEGESPPGGHGGPPGGDSLSSEPLVRILAFCLLANHFHLLLQQLADDGISKYLHRLQMGYTCYFNLKNDRSGALFQGQFKARLINSDEYLTWLSAYIHGNPEIHGICKADKWEWSSNLSYLKQEEWGEESDHIILGQFDGKNDYQKFVEMVIQKSREKKNI